MRTIDFSTFYRFSDDGNEQFLQIFLFQLMTYRIFQSKIKFYLRGLSLEFENVINKYHLFAIYIGKPAILVHGGIAVW